MRALLLPLLLGSVTAGAATFEGSVVFDGAPVPEARVRLFVRSEEAVLGCPPFRDGAVLGPCACPAGVEALTARLLKGEGGARPVVTTTTDATGKFTVPLPGPVVLIAVIASKDELLAGQAELRGSKQVFRLERTVPLRLAPGSSPKGAVIYKLNRRTRELVRVADPDAVRVPPGGQHLIFVAPGMLPVVSWARDAVTPVFAPVPQRDPRLTSITLEPPGPLKGLVTLDGKPVAGAHYVLDPEGCAITGQSDENGEITITGTAELSAKILEVRSGELGARAHFHRGRVNPLPLTKVGQLDVTFVDPKGAAAQGVEAYLFFGSRDWTARAADENGRWSQGVLPLGEVQLRLLPPWVLLDDGRTTLAGVVKRQLRVQKGVPISGRVIDAAGFPVDRVTVIPYFADEVAAKVSADAKDGLRWSRRAWTDQGGEFEIAGLLPGPYKLVATRDGAEVGSVLATAPGRVELQKLATFQLTGTVVEEGGAPVAGAWVALSRSGGGGSAWSARTDLEGNFRVEVPAPGSYQASAWRDNPGEAARKLVQITGKNTPPARLEMPRLPAGGK